MTTNPDVLEVRAGITHDDLCFVIHNHLWYMLGIDCFWYTTDPGKDLSLGVPYTIGSKTSRLHVIVRMDWTSDNWPAEAAKLRSTCEQFCLPASAADVAKIKELGL